MFYSADSAWFSHIPSPKRSNNTTLLLHKRIYYIYTFFSMDNLRSICGQSRGKDGKSIYRCYIHTPVRMKKCRTDLPVRVSFGKGDLLNLLDKFFSSFRGNQDK